MEILYEDNHLLIVNKRPGQLSQGDKTSDMAIADQYKAYIKEKYGKPGNVFLHPVHRLDRPVSGCLIMARTSKALSRLTTAFREGKVRKHYIALSNKRSPKHSETLRHYLLKDSRKNIVMIVHPDNHLKNNKHPNSKAKYAELDYVQVDLPEYPDERRKYLYHIQPKTGRSHQIRVQMSHRGMPIIGDLKYGGTKWSDAKSIALHCLALVFEHPTKKETLTVKCMPHHKEWQKFYKMIDAVTI